MPTLAPTRDRLARLSSARLLFLAGAILLIGWLAVKSWRLVGAARSLQSVEAELTQIQEAGLGTVDPARLGDLVIGVRRDVLVIRQETRLFWPVLPALGWLPRIGPLLAEAPDLIELADAGTAAAAYAWQGVGPGLTTANDGAGLSVSRLLAAAAGAGPELAQAAREVDRAAAALARIEAPERLPWRVRRLLEPLAAYLPIAQDGLALAPVLDRLLGVGKPSTYLFVAQNEDELRPTGGFISGVGLLRIDAGRIADLSFDDANVIDNWAEQPYDFPPDVGAVALYDFMGSELFLFRDANYWADFPRSAEAMMHLYRYGQGDLPLDGVIAIDQRFLEMLVGAVGPLRVPELAGRVTGENVLDLIREAWEPEVVDGSLREWIGSRKSFMSPLATALRQKLEGPNGQTLLPRVAHVAVEGVRSRHLQIYAVDPATAAILRDLGWDGRLPMPAEADVLSVVDMNVGFNKANAVVTSRLDYAVTLAEDGRGEAAVRVTYVHAGTPPPGDCVHRTDYTAETRYALLVNDCYWNYARIYAPAGASLLAGSSAPVAADMFVSRRPWPGDVQATSEPPGHTVFGNFHLIYPGEELTATYRYQLPPVVRHLDDGSTTYTLHLVKQAGTAPQPTRLRVTVPPGATIEAVSEAAATVAGGAIVFDTVLDANLVLSVIYR